MTPTYAVGTHLYGAPISTRLERGDVVILDDGQADYAVKRIVGLPGETVQLWRGQVFINREMLVEPYLPKHVYTYPAEPLRRGATFVLGEDQYIVLGDNRPSSADSRTYGPVSRKQIKRRVPQSEDFVGAYFAPYTLPDYGNSMIRPLSASVRRRPESSVSEKRSEPGASRGAPSAALKSEGRNPKAEARTALGLGFRYSDFGTRPSFGPRVSAFGFQLGLRPSGFGFDPRLCLGVTHRAAQFHWLEAFSGGTLVVEGDVLGSGGCPSLARNNARTSGGSPVLESSMRRRTS